MSVDQECVTIVYQNGPDVRFNFDYYINTHMPLIMQLYGKSISRFELRRGQLGADVPKFTNAVLVAQRDRIVGAASS